MKFEEWKFTYCTVPAYSYLWDNQAGGNPTEARDLGRCVVSLGAKQKQSLILSSLTSPDSVPELYQRQRNNQVSSLMQFLELPLELRSEIFSLVLSPNANRVDKPDGDTVYDYREALSLLTVNQQVFHEARKVFRALNTFVLIETPWIDAKVHVVKQGRVCILCDGETADNFQNHTMRCSISPPHYPADTPMDRFVILVDDLSKFCSSWYYSNVDMPSMNSHLGLRLTLRDPFTPVYEEKRIPRALQERLLLPFGQVKGLLSFSLTGDPAPLPSVEKKLRDLMAVPLDSPETCLVKATHLKDEGNRELQSGRYAEALELYNQSWLAMHIVIAGRERHVYGDQFFHGTLTEPPYAGKDGTTERTILRIRLVANTVLAYLKLKQYDEAIYIGMRTIKILRFHMDVPVEDGADDATEEANTSFIAATEMGKIYYRTALAYKELDDKYEARRLLKVAVIYLPNDRQIHREIQDCALRVM